MDPKDVAIRFNEAINDRDVDGLAELMADDHVFVDAAGDTVSGRERCLGGWREFFRQFPDYENVFASVTERGSLVTMVGRSNCSDERLDGPAIWTAEVETGKISEWRVYDDTTDNRRRLGIEDGPEG